MDAQNTDPQVRGAGNGQRPGASADVRAQIKALIVVPTYNESDNVAELIARILAQPLDCEVLIVDDASPDGTAEIVSKLAAQDSRVHLMRRPGKMGLGSAYRDGFRYALEKTRADLIFQMDADFSHDPEALTEFLDAAAENDLVLGSRYLKGVTVVNWPLSRLFLSYGANLYSRIITGMVLKDATGGFKCFRREVLETLDWSRIRSDGYSFQIETTYMAWRRGFRIKEIPIIFVDRRVGISKMNRRIVVEAIFLVWRLAFANLFRRVPPPRPVQPLIPLARGKQ
jgi:dolichol-phosphate mannosyltransferase